MVYKSFCDRCGAEITNATHGLELKRYATAQIVRMYCKICYDELYKLLIDNKFFERDGKTYT